MEKSYLIGVDIGTAGTKAAIFDTEGRMVADAYEESKLRYPKPGWVEQDQEDFYRSAANTIRRAINKSNIHPRDVAAIAFDGQMAGIGGIDFQWKPVTHYDSWLDTRCQPYIEFMKERSPDLVLKKTGSAPSYSHGPKILWWKNENKEVFHRISKFIVPAGYVAGKMVGLEGDDAFIDHTYLVFGGF
ncbi:MAG: FGGY family carbohydrate kinase, partial [bacterium]